MLEKLKTENRNSESMKIDECSIVEILQIMNAEDKKVPEAIANEIELIGKAVEYVVDSLKKGGRLIYIGAGTSGRLGVLDAAECPPTYGIDDSIVLGLIAGGESAFLKAVEGAEDSYDLAIEDLSSVNLNKNDTVIGLAASGRTPYVIGGLKYAKDLGAHTVAIACNKNAKISKYSDLAIEIETGAEVVTGSTRLKAGTAQKNVLNMISTGAMICMGKVYSNLMVDMQSTNYKLEQRAIRMILEVLDVKEEEAVNLLKLSDGNVKLAIFMGVSSLSKGECIKLLEENGGFLKKALKTID